MIDSNDIIGKVFGRLTVLEYLGKGKHVYLCMCSCGNTTEVHRDRLLAGRTKSCGCFQKDRVTTHGGTIRDGSMYSAAYRSWESIKLRCNNKNHKDYKNYGARGISYCKGWEKFENFYKDMGDRPEGTTIGRIDNEGNYCKDNCRWETPEQQQNNTRASVKIEGYTISDIVKATGLNYNTVELRLRRGRTVEEILNSPAGKRSDATLKDFSEDIGKRNGKLVVEKIYSEVNSKGVKQTIYDCKCDCGITKTVVRGNFLKTFSCGCLKSAAAKERCAREKELSNKY